MRKMKSSPFNSLWGGELVADKRAAYRNRSSGHLSWQIADRYRFDSD
jgi:hypothetical protein